MFSTDDSIQQFLEQSAQIALVRVEQAKGSVPRDTGTWMLVAPDNCFGTIGGGQLEYMAIDEARALFRNAKSSRILNIPLGPEIGQCCGGNIRLTVDVLDHQARLDIMAVHHSSLAAYPSVYVFGAGHVGRALIAALTPLPVKPVMIDTRPAEMALVPETVEKHLVALPEEVVRSAQPASAFVVLTHDHSLDFLITREALLRGDARYVGMIGSKTKRAVFGRWCRGFSNGNVKMAEMTCPIGGGRSRDKRPEVIAAFVAAEVIARMTDSVIEPGKLQVSPQEREEIND